MTENGTNNKVPYNVFSENNERIHGRINKLQDELRTSNNDLRQEIYRVSVYMENTQDLQQKFYEEQKATNQYLSKIVEQFGEYSKELITIKRDIKDAFEDIEDVKSEFDKEIKGIQEELKSKKNYNITLITAIITAVGGIIIAAVNIAPILFTS